MRIKWQDDIIDSLDMSLSKRWCRCPRDGVGAEKPGVLHCIGSQRVGCNSAIDQQPPICLSMSIYLPLPFESSILFSQRISYLTDSADVFDEGGYVTIKPSHLLGHGLSTSFMLSLRVKRFELSRRITTQKFKVLVSLQEPYLEPLERRVEELKAKYHILISFRPVNSAMLRHLFTGHFQ